MPEGAGAPDADVRRRGHRRACARQVERSGDRVEQRGVVDRELQEVDGADAHDVAQATVRPVVEGEHHRHGRVVLTQPLEPREAGLGRQAGAGDEHVERAVIQEQFADTAHPRA